MTKLVFEGVDRVGKSSFIAYAAERLKWPVVKMHVPKTVGEAVRFYNQYWEELSRPGDLIYDRGHISETVYAPLYRPHLCNYFWPSGVYAGEVLVRDVVLVYVYPKYAQLMLPDERPGANLMNELSRYEAWLKLSSLPIIRICSHAVNKIRWRTHAEMFDELMDALTEYSPKA